MFAPQPITQASLVFEVHSTPGQPHPAFVTFSFDTDLEKRLSAAHLLAQEHHFVSVDIDGSSHCVWSTVDGSGDLSADYLQGTSSTLIRITHDGSLEIQGETASGNRFVSESLSLPDLSNQLRAGLPVSFAPSHSEEQLRCAMLIEGARGTAKLMGISRGELPEVLMRAATASQETMLDERAPAHLAGNTAEYAAAYQAEVALIAMNVRVPKGDWHDMPHLILQAFAPYRAELEQTPHFQALQRATQDAGQLATGLLLAATFKANNEAERLRRMMRER